MTRTTRTLLVVCLALLAVGAIAVPGTASPQSPETPTSTLASDHVYECAATPPDGDTEDVVGWVDGFWYNEPVEIEDPDELTEDELEDLIARTAARVEALRCLTFAEVPPAEMVTREEYQADLESFYEEEVTAEDADFYNAQFAALLMVGTEEDAINELIENQAAFIPAPVVHSSGLAMGVRGLAERPSQSSRRSSRITVGPCGVG